MWILTGIGSLPDAARWIFNPLSTVLVPAGFHPPEWTDVLNPYQVTRPGVRWSSSELVSQNVERPYILGWVARSTVKVTAGNTACVARNTFAVPPCPPAEFGNLMVTFAQCSASAVTLKTRGSSSTVNERLDVATKVAVLGTTKSVGSDEKSWA